MKKQTNLRLNAVTTPPVASHDRVVGYDIARSLAILGMILVHFSLVMAMEKESPFWLATLLRLLDGRAAATFVVLAGVGLSLIARKAADAEDTERLAGIRSSITRRGLLLFVLGILNTTIWTGDILRVYGVTFLVAARFLRASNRTLLGIALGFALVFVGLILFVDFEKNWDWSTLTYRNLWTVEGFLRNLFYDGFRSVFPWSGLVFFGMWFGRLPLHDPQTNRKVFVIAALVLIGAELLSAASVAYCRKHGLDQETATALFGTVSMPALPIFLAVAVSTAVCVIAISVRIGEIQRLKSWLSPIADTGRMALTWYVAHIVLGLGAVVATGHDSKHSLQVAMATGLAFYLLAVLVSWIWMRCFRHGPLEWLMRLTAN